MAASLSPEDIRERRAAHPTMRERDFAKIHDISEAQLVASLVGDTAIRLRPDVATLLHGAKTLGPVMVLTRNESAVHEKIGPFEKVLVGDHAALVLGAQVDLRIFPDKWASGFAVTKGEGESARRSLQFFDAAGDAVHKIHLRPESDQAAYDALVAKLRSDDQSQVQEPGAVPDVEAIDASRPQADAEALREAWSRMTDTHQFFGMLRDLNLPRRQALEMVGPDYVRAVTTASVPLLFDKAVENGVPLMAFVGNTGCIQIHTGPIGKVAMMGPWLNVMDETFHLHLRTDHIASAYVVQKPLAQGHVTSLEAYNADGKLIIQFFGQRIEGQDELPLWRQTLADLPSLAAAVAA